MTAHEKRQAMALSLIMALFDMVKRGEEAGTYRYRKAAEMEIRVCNLVNDWRNMSFEQDDRRRLVISAIWLRPSWCVVIMMVKLMLRRCCFLLP